MKEDGAAKASGPAFKLHAYNPADFNSGIIRVVADLLECM